MGGGASTRTERKEKEVERHRCMRAVERFVINVYATCPRVESMILLLSSELARKSFALFVKSERAEENFNLYNEVLEVKNKKLNTYQLSKEVERLIDEYIKPDTAMQVIVTAGTRETAQLLLEADKDSNNYVDDLYKFLSKLIEETVFLMARDQFNRFILSKYYKTWRATESSHAIATTAEDATLIASRNTQGSLSPNLHGHGNNHDTPHQQQHLQHNTEATTSTNSGGRRKKVAAKKHEDLSVRAFMNIDVHEIGRLLGAESWLAALVAAAEGLPLCFSLASARKDRRGFPLLYVNKYFEKLTGFTRSDIIGKNCKFLQCADSERDKIQGMSEALKAGQSNSCVITNKTYSGRIYKNLVCLRPIFNEAGVYCYVIAIHIDVTREVDDYVSKMKMALELIEMLPTTLLHDDMDKHESCLPL